MTDRCFYFGCWNEPGHWLYIPGGRKWYSPERELEYCHGADGERLHIDASLAPRMHGNGAIWWVAKAKDKWHRDVEGMNSRECPQGQFLLHYLTNGFTAIQWWDRCQGDKRGACNSTILREGEHTSAGMLAALAESFPHVLDNLKRAGVELVEVTP